MARLTKEQWKLARIDYEVHGFSYTDLTKKYGMSRGSVSGRVNKEGWEQGRNEHLVNKKVNAIKELRETEQQIEQLEPAVQLAVDHEAEKRLEHIELFQDSAIANQHYANEMLEVADGMASMMELNAHSQLTQRNKETVLGKDVTTAVQVNNNIEGSVIDSLVAKRLGGK